MHIIKPEKVTFFVIMLTFLVNSLGIQPIYAQMSASTGIVLPPPGQMVQLSSEFSPVVIKGLRLYKNDPLRISFYMDKGDAVLDDVAFRQETRKLIKYFLASLTIPSKDLWVNLSPYEKDRIVPQEFGQTTMGRDLLAQDYVLKQLTSSLIYPESQLGKSFWDKVYKEAKVKYGTTNVPVNTFNKVWILPDKVVVNEHEGEAFVVQNHLKVMLEEDYVSLYKNNKSDSPHKQTTSTHTIASQIIKELVLPVLEKEVNEGKNFAPLRQVFYSLILATWYKNKVKNSILNKVYSNQDKISGINVSALERQKIYLQYLKAFKKGVFNYIKDEQDLATRQNIPRKYFSGGVEANLDQKISFRSDGTVPDGAMLEVDAEMGLADKAQTEPAKQKAINAIDDYIYYGSLANGWFSSNHDVNNSLQILDGSVDIIWGTKKIQTVKGNDQIGILMMMNTLNNEIMSMRSVFSAQNNGIRLGEQEEKPLDYKNEFEAFLRKDKRTVEDRNAYYEEVARRGEILAKYYQNISERYAHQFGDLLTLLERAEQTFSRFTEDNLDINKFVTRIRERIPIIKTQILDAIQNKEPEIEMHNLNRFLESVLGVHPIDERAKHFLALISFDRFMVQTQEKFYVSLPTLKEEDSGTGVATFFEASHEV